MNDPYFDAPPSGDDLVTVASFDDAVSARLAFNHLREAGLPAVLMDENTVAMDWLLSNAIGGIKIQVNPKDATAARQLIDDHERQRAGADTGSAPLFGEADEKSLAAQALAARPDDAVGDEDEPDVEEEPPRSTREQLAVYAFRGALLGILLLPLEFYVLYLLYKVFVSDERLGARYRNLAIVAGIIMLIVLGGCYAVIRPR
jgi:hypothetical protein